MPHRGMPVRRTIVLALLLAGFFGVTLVLIASTWAQTESRPYSRAAAEKSFRALVTAKDSDMMDVLKNDGYVCFADGLPFDNEDRFLTIVLPKPTAWFPEKKDNDKDYHSLYDETTDSAAWFSASLDLTEWENQDSTILIMSMLDGYWHSYGHYQRLKDGTAIWKPYGDIPPVFRFAADKDISGATNVSATEDGTTFYATRKYENKNKGTTIYEMNMRLSTGRYTETWTTDKDEAFKSVGNCYKAKEFICNSTPPKKPK